MGLTGTTTHKSCGKKSVIKTKKEIKMSQKKYDLAVKTGTYINGQGEEKGRYENIGAVMVGENGPFLMLKTTFNPAGVPNPDNRDSILVSCFEPQQRQQPVQQQQQQQQQPRQQQQQQQDQRMGDGVQQNTQNNDFDIPF